MEKSPIRYEPISVWAMGRLEPMLIQLYDNGDGLWVWPLSTIHHELIVEIWR